MNQLPVEDPNGPHYAISERPCPTCRAPMQKEMIFQRKTFEPTDEDLEEEQLSPPIAVLHEDTDDELPVFSGLLEEMKKFQGKSKGKSKYKKRFTQRIPDSDEDFADSDDSLNDFIMQSDEDEEEKDARRELKRKLTRNRRIVLDSDDESNEDDEDDEVELLHPKIVRKKKGKTVERFLPSTKMKVRFSTVHTLDVHKLTFIPY
jgi:hypothetical protein